MRRSLALSLAAAGLFLFGLAALELVRGPPLVHLGSVHLPARHLQALAALTAAAFAAALLTQQGSDSPRRRAVIAGLVAATAMLANTRLIGSGDTRPAAYFPFAIARTQSLTFEQTIESSPCLLQPDGSFPYWFVSSHGRTVSKYPLTTGLLALPIELPSALGTFDLCAEDFNDLEKIAAVVLAALGVALLFFTFEKLAGVGAATLGGFLYVLATPVLPILGQALWQHTGACLGFSLAIWALFARPGGSKRAALVALGAGLGVACRPPDVFLALGLMLALLAEGRRHLTAWLMGALPLGLLGICNWETLGSPWATGYGTEGVGGWTTFWPEGLAGLLFSPARGLLLLYPVLIFAIAALVRAQSQSLRTIQFRLLAASTVAHLALMAKWWCWTGGYSPAPRMLSDGLPILGIGLALAAGAPSASKLGRSWFASAAVFSALCTCLVTYIPPAAATHEWIWSMSDGPWNWRAYPPVAYWLGRSQAERK